MAVYVRSRGVRTDYEWHEVREDVDVSLEGRLPEQYVRYQFDQVIDNDSGGCILGRFDGKLVLLVASVPSRQRTDFVGRLIRDSVFVVGDSDAEHEVRGFMADAIRR